MTAFVPPYSPSLPDWQRQVSNAIATIRNQSDPAFSINKQQVLSQFSSFQMVANGVPINSFQAITINGTVLASTNANFLATATPDNVTFSGWGVRGGAGTNSLVTANFGTWIENNSALTWAVEIDSNNEGATQPEGSDTGGVGLAVNTGSTYSPDTAIWIRRMTGAGSAPGFLRGITIEGARNVGLRIMAMDTTTYPSLTPAAPGTITAIAIGKSSDAMYRFTIFESGQHNWGNGTSAPDVSLSRGGVGVLNCSGVFGATQYFVGANAVVGARRIGWTAPTGTATRTGFATGTATLQNVAEALKALIDDLTAHGLIGA